MRPLGTYRLAPALPEALAPLSPLARDLRATWREEVRALFRDIDPEEWERSGNPVVLLRTADPARLASLAADEAYVGRVLAVARAIGVEDAALPWHPVAAALAASGDRIAYFCAEFGLTEILPIYSGGLGVLAGDHLKSSSDLGVPLVGVGLFYREGFSRQMLTADARQKETYPVVDPHDLPIDILPTSAGVAPIVSVRVGERDVHLLVRRVRVGRTTLLLLDSHLPVNRPSDREITNRLYGGDKEMRIRQELALGIGGMRALDLAGLRPTVRHANEGHAAFLGLERIRQLRAERGLSFSEAREIAMAGIDLFPSELMKKYFAGKVDAYGISFDELLGLGRQVPEDPHEFFSMAVLGLRLSAHVNGVSKLHAHVSRRLWRGVFPEAPLSEIPIAVVTNGVHPDTWTAPAIAALGPRREEGADRGELWRRHEGLRAALVHAVRFPREEELNRPVRVLQEPRDALRIVKDQRGALVGREAAGESDREGRRVEELPRGLDLDVRSAAALARDGGSRAHGMDERRPEALVPAPELPAVRALLAPRPEGGDRRRGPRVRMDSVRHDGDRDLRERRLRKNAAPQAARHVRMQLRDAVDVRREAQPEHGHREELVRVLGNLPSKPEELVERDAVSVDLAGEVLLHQLGREEVDPRRDGRVRREDASRHRDLARLGERQASFGAELADPLEPEKRGVSLVRVAHCGPEAREIERAHAADTERQLLADPHLLVAPVEAVRDLAIARPIHREVRIEKEKRRAADPNAADEEMNVPLADAHTHDRRDARRRRKDVDWQVVRIGDRVGLLLPRIRRQRLAEEPLAVEVAVPHERDPEIARGLELVAREDAEPARIDRQDLRETELRAEIRDAIAGSREGGGGRVPRRCRILDVERPRDRKDALHVWLVGGQSEETRRVGGPEEDDGVPVSLPLLGIEIPE